MRLGKNKHRAQVLKAKAIDTELFLLAKTRSTLDNRLTRLVKLTLSVVIIQPGSVDKRMEVSSRGMFESPSPAKKTSQ